MITLELDILSQKLMPHAKARLQLITTSPLFYWTKTGQNGHKPPANATFYRWWSHSPYLGRELEGKYCIVNCNLQYKPDGTPKWHGITNPVGLFFDSTSNEKPFLVLYDFKFSDTLLRKYPRQGKLGDPISGNWVEWHKYF